jgi:hypothetical protein
MERLLEQNRALMGLEDNKDFLLDAYSKVVEHAVVADIA